MRAYLTLLQGTGPWDIEVQIVHSKGTQSIEIKGIETHRKRIQIPVPSHVDRSGGAFDIGLSSVTDKEGCKRVLNVPGINVNVRRILPTVKFYGQESKRRAIILEGDEAKLPLRLTGDGVCHFCFSAIAVVDLASSLGTSNIVTTRLPSSTHLVPRHRTTYLQSVNLESMNCSKSVSTALTLSRPC